MVQKMQKSENKLQKKYKEMKKNSKTKNGSQNKCKK